VDRVYVFVVHISLEEVVENSSEHIQDLSDLSLAMPSLLALLNFPLEFILAYVSYHELDTQVAIVSISCCVSGRDHPHAMGVGPVGAGNFEI